ncbi:MAG: anthranilate phosphoribosyltransferase [Acidobacteria bacterium]|nr:anthranilate phosphoribosyltransferase [Acidobacteriota bacterium]
MTISAALKKNLDHQSLTADEAEAVLEQIMTGLCSEAQVAALLTALRMKGETVDELTGFARVMRRKAAAVRVNLSTGNDLESAPLIDTCGTGGDVSGSFNISTAAAFVVAGCGLRVAKHGNRSVSSHCGSADVMEALGVKLELAPAHIASCIEEIGIGFLHAPLLHEAMKHVASVRRQLGVRTIFNLLGPLTNPAGANAQVIGVYAPHLTEMFAHTLNRLGSRRALVVHGSDGLDEITITGTTRVTELRHGQVQTYTLQPEDFGLTRGTLAALQGGDARHNAEMIIRLLDGEASARRDIVLLNAAAALVVGNRAKDFHAGIELAVASLDSGAAMAKLQSLIAFSQRY